MKRIERAKIKALLEALKEKYTVFAPILKNGTVVFDRMEDVESVQLHFSNTVHSPKALFFPQTEQLLSQIEDGWKENLPPEENSILFGLRPCDARGIGLLDKVFSGDDFEDPYYLIRREKSLIVSLACQHPRMSCFCSSLNSGPHAEEAADIILFETSDAYLLKALSDKGEQLVKEVSGLLSKPKASDQGELEKQKKAAERSWSPVSNWTNWTRNSERISNTRRGMKSMRSAWGAAPVLTCARPVTVSISSMKPIAGYEAGTHASFACSRCTLRVTIPGRLAERKCGSELCISSATAPTISTRHFAWGVDDAYSAVR